MTDHGVDLSSYNSVSNWASVHTDGIEWASVKLTQGNYYQNPGAAGQIAGARSVGIVAGGYCFGDPRDGAQSNVDTFAEMGRALDVFAPGSFLPMLDIENDPADGVEWDPATANRFVPDWIRILRGETGILDVAVYANLNDWHNLLRPDEWADQHVFLWLADYNGEPGTLEWNHPRLAIHQHTSQGNVPGIGGWVDKNVTVNGYSVDDLTLHTHQEDDDMAGSIWVWHNKDTGAAAIVYPTGRMTGVSAGTDPGDVIQADNVPVLSCDTEMWEDQRRKSDLAEAAEQAVISLANATTGGTTKLEAPPAPDVTPGKFRLTEHRVLVPDTGEDSDSTETTSAGGGHVVSPNPED